jgi:hypothetical protein
MFSINAVTPTFIGRAFRRASALLLLTLLLALGSAFVGTKAWISAGARPAPAAVPGDVSVLLLVLRPTGFEPSEVTLPKGTYLLVVQNRTGLRGFALQLDRVGGGRLHEVRLPERKLDWNGEFDLTPGDYVLREADHPDWNCRLIITP